jgi:hypothetical protein
MAPSTQAGWLAEAPAINGLNPANFVPASLQPQALTIATNSVPSGANSAAFIQYCSACLIARGIIYEQDNGPCGTAPALGISDAQETGLAGQAASTIASFAGTALPGIGIVVSAIESIFSDHAAAVANEEKVICQVAGVLNQVFPYYDNLVRTGTLSPTAAYAGMQTFLAQVNAQLQTIYKVCNASCYVMAIVAAHSKFVQVYYPAIAPVQAVAHAPGAAPTVNGTTPGGIVQVGTTNPSTASNPVAAAATAIANTATASTLGFLTIFLIVALIGAIIYSAVKK